MNFDNMIAARIKLTIT